MFQKSLKRCTAKKDGKYITPDLKVETLADIYTLYVLNAEIPINDFWNQDVTFLELVYFNKLAWNNWSKNPKER